MLIVIVVEEIFIEQALFEYLNLQNINFALLGLSFRKSVAGCVCRNLYILRSKEGPNFSVKCGLLYNQPSSQIDKLDKTF